MVMSPRVFLQAIEAQAAALEKFEERARAAAARPMRASFRELVREVAARWAILSGPITDGDKASLSVITSLFGKMRDHVPDLRPLAVEAVGFGVEQAFELDDDTEHITDYDTDWPKDDTDDLPSDLEDAIDVRDTVEDRIDSAGLYLRSRNKPTKRDVDTATAIAGRSITAVEQAASRTVVRGAARGQDTIAKATGKRTIWRAERSACLICLAYAGMVSTTAGTWPPGLTYGTRPHKGRLRVKPPEHPNCRCTSPLYSPRGDPAGAVAAALRREAQRSVLKGWTGSESERESRRAAAMLLAAGTDLPASVEVEARRRLRSARKFSRAVPG